MPRNATLTIPAEKEHQRFLENMPAAVPVTVDRNKLREALNVPVPHDLHGRTYAQLLAEEYFMQAVTGNAVRQSVRIAELWEAVVDRLSV